MVIRLRQTKIYKKEIFFLLSYICFFISLFLSDIGIATEIDNVTISLRYTSYMLGFIQLLMHKEKTKHFMIELIIFALTIVFFVSTNDIYLPMLAILIVGSRDSSEIRVCNVSLKLLTFGTALVVIGNLVGFIPDIMTAKAFSTDLTRHSYGFYHSNVLPNNLLMVEILAVWKYKDKISNLAILIFLLLHTFVYGLAGSRICLIVGIMITLSLIALKQKAISLKINKKLSTIVYFITPFFTIISVTFMLLVHTNSLVNKIDVFFSNRFWAAFLKASRVGIKLFNFSTNAFFYKDELAIDNGYLFLLMRYGIIALLAINVISMIMVKNNRNQIYHLICVISLFTVAFIDNLFLSYRFLPFLIFTFMKMNKRRNYDEEHMIRKKLTDIKWSQKTT